MRTTDGRADSSDRAIRWVRSPVALSRRVPDGVIVLLLPDGHPELVTGPGGALWELLAAPRTLAELTAVLADRYDHDPVVVRRDLEETVAGLADRALIEVA